jgi:hypothetical protein
VSKFKVGDVCVWQNVKTCHTAINGHECTVLEVVDLSNGDYIVECPSFPSSYTGGVWAADENQLRLKPPKDDAEPRSDFTPCDEDFSEWMKKLERVGA